MVKFEIIRALIAKNLHNLEAHQIIEIFSILYSAYMVPRDQNKIVFYVNNYINWD